MGGESVSVGMLLLSIVLEGGKGSEDFMLWLSLACSDLDFPGLEGFMLRLALIFSELDFPGLGTFLYLLFSECFLVLEGELVCRGVGVDIGVISDGNGANISSTAFCIARDPDGGGFTMLAADAEGLDGANISSTTFCIARDPDVGGFSMVVGLGVGDFTKLAVDAGGLETGAGGVVADDFGIARSDADANTGGVDVGDFTKLVADAGGVNIVSVEAEGFTVDVCGAEAGDLLATAGCSFVTVFLF